MESAIKRIGELVARGKQFTFDMRGNCRVYTGIVVAYGNIVEHTAPASLPEVMSHALAHDGVVGCWFDGDGTAHYESCRLFTDLSRALKFAGEQGRQTVYNLNREEVLQVNAPMKPPEHAEDVLQQGS